jgi:myo-inositol 2-dehydrogenase/D-chiro-inositol 1-dehydrogenase
MLNVGLLGAGRIGKVHARSITSHPASRLVAVSDLLKENAQKLASEYGADVRSSDKMIAGPSIDAILVATSTDTHSDMIEAATAAGKAVLCEKPVNLNLERSRACLARALTTRKPIMIGFNRRFDPHFRTLKAAVDNDEIGKPEPLPITSFNPASPPISYVKTSGSLFRDMMIHDFDMANFLMRETPVTIVATGSVIVVPEIRSTGDIGTAVVTMTYADGRITVIKNLRRAVYGCDQRVEIFGSKGLLQAHNVLENTVVKSTAIGVSSAKPT